MPDYNDSVFINCPFDKDYTPILRAIIFAVYKCGFFSVTSLAEDNGLHNRLEKIERLIDSCKYGIHDISRTELNEHRLPRFNMPFELGIFFGAKKFGNKKQKSKVAIILDTDQHRYTEFITDLRGIDIKAHGNNVEVAIRKVRDSLATSSRRATIPGHRIIIREYDNLLSKLPLIVDDLGLELNDLPFNDYCYIVEEAIRTTL